MIFKHSTRINPSLSFLLLVVSNFLFVGSYAFLGANALFISKFNADEMSLVVLGMSMFAAFQVGGVWFVSLFKNNLERSQLFLILLRTLAILLMSTSNAYFIFLSLCLFGLSQSLFYKRTRKQIANYIKSGYKKGEYGYLYFGITTNLAYMLFPFMGANVIFRNLQSSLGLAIGGIVFIFSICCLYISEVEESSDQDKSVEKNECKVSGENRFAAEFVFDVIRLLAFLLPYCVINALIPIKVKSAGLLPSYNALLLGLNSIIIIVMQIIASFKKDLFVFTFKKYDYISIFAVGITVLSLYCNVWLLALLVVVYSFVESYQLPNIETLLFSKRKYSDHALNRFLVIDSVVCFLGPLFAIHSLDYSFSSVLDENVRTILSYLVKMG